MFLIFVIPLVFIAMENKYPDNDIWFLLNGGRYVLNNGLPHTDPFTIHEGFKFVMQQWPIACLFYFVYDLVSYKGLLAIIYIMSVLNMFVLYKLCYLVSEKKLLSVIVTSIVFSLSAAFMIIRPQLFSYLMLLLELLLVELYIKKKNVKYLIGLPIISLIFINVHASMWFMQFCLLLPFIINAIRIKKLKFIDKLYVDSYKLKPLIYTTIVMLLVGFINPYGIDAITYLFKSYGIERINTVIGEMQPLVWISLLGKSVFFVSIFIFFLLYVRRDIKLDVRYFLLLCGTLLLSVMHVKAVILYFFIAAYSIMAFMKNVDLKIKWKVFESKVFISLKNGVVFGLSLSLIITFGVTMYYSFTFHDFNNAFNYDKPVNYIVENYDINDVRLYVDFNNGGYAEWNGLKSYIDGRAELFFKKFNGKEDIFDEAFDLDSKASYDFESFVEKYNFTHLIVYSYSGFYRYLETCEDYEEVYKYRDSDQEEAEINIVVFVRKDVQKIGDDKQEV